MNTKASRKRARDPDIPKREACDLFLDAARKINYQLGYYVSQMPAEAIWYYLSYSLDVHSQLLIKNCTNGNCTNGNCTKSKHSFVLMKIVLTCREESWKRRLERIYSVPKCCWDMIFEYVLLPSKIKSIQLAHRQTNIEGRAVKCRRVRGIMGTVGSVHKKTKTGLISSWEIVPSQAFPEFTPQLIIRWVPRFGYPFGRFVARMSVLVFHCLTWFCVFDNISIFDTISFIQRIPMVRDLHVGSRFWPSVWRGGLIKTKKIFQSPNKHTSQFFFT
jgi:hypothetical protein